MAQPKIKSDGRTITVRVPISIRRRGGRKVVLAPDGSQHDPSRLRCRQVDNAIAKALARAFRWRQMLESGQYATIVEIAAEEKINESYVSRLLRLTLLAPDIVVAILEGEQSPKVTLAVLLQRLPISWHEQRTTLFKVPEVSLFRDRPNFKKALGDFSFSPGADTGIVQIGRR